MIKIKRLFIVTAAFSLCWLWVSPLVNAQTNNTTAALQALDTQIRQSGLVACAIKLRALAKYIMSDNEVNFVLHPVGAQPSGAITLAISQINPKSGVKGIASITLVPINNSCIGTYEQVNHWLASCTDVKSQVFVNYAKPRQVQRDIFQSELNGLTHTYFIPDQSGCTTVKKELIQ